MASTVSRRPTDGGTDFVLFLMGLAAAEIAIALSIIIAVLSQLPLRQDQGSCPN